MAPKHTKQHLTEMKGKTDYSTIMVGNLNTLLSIMERINWIENQQGSRRHSSTVNQLDLKDS